MEHPRQRATRWALQLNKKGTTCYCGKRLRLVGGIEPGSSQEDRLRAGLQTAGRSSCASAPRSYIVTAPLPFLVLVLLLTIGAASEPRTGPNDNSAMRSYSQGPLTLEDYKAPIPNDTGGLDAVTTSDIRFDYDYQVRLTRGRATAYATELKIDAVVIPSKSWIRLRSDARLMDHEQGHFDITYIAALQARLEAAKLAKKRQRFIVTAATSAAAIDLLGRKVQQFMQPFFDAASAEQQEYDVVTKHGRVRTAQADQRRKQIETIKSVNEELKRIDR